MVFETLVLAGLFVLVLVVAVIGYFTVRRHVSRTTSSATSRPIGSASYRPVSGRRRHHPER